MARILLTMMLICVPGLALSGAWPRAVGTTFLSFSHAADVDDSGAVTGGFTSLYAEFGMTPNLTVGVDAGRAETGDGQIVAFLRYPVGPNTGPWRTALKGGVGLRDHGSGSEAVAQIEFNLGRGTETGWGQGWVALDTSATYGFGTSDVILKSDLTIGLGISDATKVFVQFQAGRQTGQDATLILAPALVQRIGPGLQLELGAYAPLIGSGSGGLKVGTWIEF